jgi:hypothetical protein
MQEAGVKARLDGEGVKKIRLTNAGGPEVNWGGKGLAPRGVLWGDAMDGALAHHHVTADQSMA